MKKFILSSLLTLTVVAISAQDSFFSNYRYSTSLTNPALMSVNDDISLTGLYRSQWMSVVRPFSTAMFEGSYPLKKSVTNEKWGIIGLSFVNDRLGEGGYMFTNQLGLSFAYNFNFGNHNLAAGLKLGYLNGGTDPNALSTGSQWNGAIYDPTVSLGEEVANPVVNGFGISPTVTWYMNDSTGMPMHYAGLTVFNVNQPKQAQLVNGFGLPMRIAVTAGTRFDIGVLGIAPSALFMLQGAQTQLVAGTDIMYHLSREGRKRKAIALGGYYRLGEAVIVSAKYLSGPIDAGLTYDLSTSSVKEGVSNSNGSLELFVNYRIGMKKANKPFSYQLEVWDESTQQRLEANISFKSLTTGKKGTLGQMVNKVDTELTLKEEYEIIVERDGYEPQTLRVQQLKPEDKMDKVFLKPEVRTFELEMEIMDKQTGDKVPAKIYRIDPVTQEKELLGEGDALTKNLESGVKHQLYIEAEGYDNSVVDVVYDKYGTLNKPVYLNKTKPKIDLAELKLKVLDEDTKKPLEVTVMISDVTVAEERTTTLMVMNSSVPESYPMEINRKYEILISKEGYFNGTVKLSIDKKEAYERVVLLRSLGVGKSIILDDLLFKVNSADIDDRSMNLLNQLVDFMNQNPTIRLEIGGHTDSDGSDAFNQQLSESRAKSAVKYLVSRGISESRLVAKGYGEVQPIAPNDSPEGKAKNRRVEMKVVE
jgi:type IX secretion system PorP/SprF family membrane protein